MTNQTFGPWRNHLVSGDIYAIMDPGIRYAVRVLHARGISTCQSCEGGPGHSYDNPSIDMVAGGEDAIGFAALAALTNAGLDVYQVSIVWRVKCGTPYEKLWRVELCKAHPELADEMPMFIAGYRATR